MLLPLVCVKQCGIVVGGCQEVCYVWFLLCRICWNVFSSVLNFQVAYLLAQVKRTFNSFWFLVHRQACVLPLRLFKHNLTEFSCFYLFFFTYFWNTVKNGQITEKREEHVILLGKTVVLLFIYGAPANGKFQFFYGNFFLQHNVCNIVYSHNHRPNIRCAMKSNRMYLCVPISTFPLSWQPLSVCLFSNQQS